MSRELELDLERDREGIDDISNRLEHKKNCKTSKTRVQNKIQAGIEQAYELLRNNELEPACNCKLVTDKDDLKAYIQQIEINGEYVIDMETTGLSVFQDIIVGVCLYTPNENETSIYVPINHTNIMNERLEGQLEMETVKELLLPILFNDNIKAINHNIKYDSKVLQYYWGGYPDNLYWDTMIAGHLLNENEKHGLKPLYEKYVDSDASGKGYTDYFGEDFPFNYIPLEVAKVYGGNDGYKTYKLYKFQEQYLRKDHQREDLQKLAHILHDIEMPLIHELIPMELRGVEIRNDFAKDLEAEMKDKLDDIENSMDEIVAEVHDLIKEHSELWRLSDEGKINYNSPTQLQYFLYDVLDITPFKKYDKDEGGWVENRSTGKDILHKLKDKYDELEEFIDLLLNYREVKKLLGTYVEKIPKVEEPKTGAVHANFNQIGARTGRFSSSHPVYRMNLQNIPARSKMGKEIRKIFKAREGYYMISADYSQIEPRTLASISGDEEMVEAYEQGKDLYAVIGSKIFDVPYEDCCEFHPETGEYQPEGDNRRDQVKSVLLGIMYERTAGDIAEQFDKPAKWGREIKDYFLESYPAVEEERKRIIHQAETYGYVNTVDGRKRRLPNMQRDNKDHWRYKMAHRQCLNSVIQGTAGDVMKKAMIAVGQDEELSRLDTHMLMTIHDELILECPKEHISRVVELVKDDMKRVGEELLDIPMQVDVEVTEYWYGEDINLEGVA